MSNITKVSYSVDINEYYQGFVTSTSMKPTEAFKELQQNIKKEKGHELCMNISFKRGEYDKGYDHIDSSKPSKLCRLYNIPLFDIIVIEDNSPSAMTYQNGVNSMKSLMKTKKSGGIGCFNFGEVLAMSVLTQGVGSVIYYNKHNNEAWSVIYLKNACPTLEPLDRYLTNVLTECKKSFMYDNMGTVKIVIPSDKYDYEYNDNNYCEICDYIDLNINRIQYNKWVMNEHITKILNNTTYKYKFSYDYYITLDGNDESTYVVNLLKYNHVNKKWYFASDIKCNGRAQSDSKSFKDITRNTASKKKPIFKVTITSLILPKEYHSDKELKKCNNIYFNVLGFLLDIKKPNDIIKLIYPNSGGNIAEKRTYTFINISCMDQLDDDKNMWIKKNIFNFYPDKLKSGDPIVNWKYIKNYIKLDMETYYSHISSDNVTGISNCFAVRNQHVPALDNSMWTWKANRKDEEGNKLPSDFISHVSDVVEVIDDSDSDIFNDDSESTTNDNQVGLVTETSSDVVHSSEPELEPEPEPEQEQESIYDIKIRELLTLIFNHEKNDTLLEKIEKMKGFLKDDTIDQLLTDVNNDEISSFSFSVE